MKPLNVLLTGYRGLAESFIDAFLENGHHLFVLARPTASLTALKSRWPRVHFTPGEVQNKKNCQDWIKSSLKQAGQLDVLINNAAITGPAGKLHELDFEEVENALTINLVAPLYLTHLFLQTAKTPVTTINLSGGGATAPRPTFSSYAISKTGLVRLTETLAQEYSEHRFYAIAPGALMTPMIESILRLDPQKVAASDFAEARRRATQGGEDPQKAAELARWLCENRPQALNGKLIHAIYDDYRNYAREATPADWWTLRRVDENCRKQLLKSTQQES